ncbi:MAG: tRNA pseudouridine(55) synthase TruB [Oscillospiraceae bacterium]|nr:tRNA pseudouridine(55) synthase TruB [Oscillospiraceae bacterium]
MDINGIILIDKPADFTSFDVVAKLRGIVRTKKIGHGGTLDPMATGVLPVFFGTATRCCSLMPEKSKRYTARFRLGISTDTQDITGKIIRESAVSATFEDVKKCAEEFLGKTEQLPPMYSAVKVNGRKLYDLARKNIEVERETRPIEVFSLDITHVEGDEYEADVACSPGTYIRTLCSDIGDKLGCGAAITYLRRTESSGFGIENCITIDRVKELMDAGELENSLLPTDSLFKVYPQYQLNEADSKMHLNGVHIWLSRLEGMPNTDGYIRIYDDQNRFLSLSYLDREQRQLAPAAYFLKRE